MFTINVKENNAVKKYICSSAVQHENDRALLPFTQRI